MREKSSAYPCMSGVVSLNVRRVCVTQRDGCADAFPERVACVFAAAWHRQRSRGQIPAVAFTFLNSLTVFPLRSDAEAHSPYGISVGTCVSGAGGVHV